MHGIVRTLCAVGRHRQSAVLALAAACSGVGPIAAHAQAVASGPDQLVRRYCTDDCEQRYERIAVDPAGNASAIWLESGTRVVVARYLASTGRWGAPTPLFNETADSVQIGVDGKGNVLAVWSTPVEENYEV